MFDFDLGSCSCLNFIFLISPHYDEGAAMWLDKTHLFQSLASFAQLRMDLGVITTVVFVTSVHLLACARYKWPSCLLRSASRCLNSS